MEFDFSDQVLHHFGFLQQNYGFWGAEETFTPGPNGGGWLRVESDRYSLEFVLHGRGPRVTLNVGRIGQPRVDMAWVFTYLTRGILPGAAPWLYYFPTFPLCQSDADSIAWQMERLAEVLRQMWPAIFIFLDMDGPRSADFTAFVERAARANSEREDDHYRKPLDILGAREHLHFSEKAQKSFAYLTAYHFKQVHADPLLVRYEMHPSDDVFTPPVYINVFHRSRSYQLGVHTGWIQADPADELNFDMDELAAWNGQKYPLPVVTKAPELPSALNHLARQFRRFAAPLLAGDTRLLAALQTRRVDAARRLGRAWEERNR